MSDHYREEKIKQVNKIISYLKDGHIKKAHGDTRQTNVYWEELEEKFGFSPEERIVLYGIALELGHELVVGTWGIYLSEVDGEVMRAFHSRYKDLRGRAKSMRYLLRKRGSYEKDLSKLHQFANNMGWTSLKRLPQMLKVLGSPLTSEETKTLASGE